MLVDEAILQEQKATLQKQKIENKNRNKNKNKNKNSKKVSEQIFHEILFEALWHLLHSGCFCSLWQCAR